MQHIEHKMSMIGDYEYLLVIRIMDCLNLKKLDVCGFEGV